MTLLRPQVLAATFAMAAAVSFAGQAQAQFQVEEPEVEKGGVEIEYNGSYFNGIPKRRVVAIDGGEEFAADDNEQKRQGHEIELGLGLTNWVRITLGAEFEEERFEEVTSLDSGDRFHGLTGTEVSANAMIVMLPLKGNGIGLSMFVGASTAIESSEGNTFTIGPAIKLAQGPFSATANLFFSKAFGGDNEEEINDDGDSVVEERFDDRWDFQYAYQFAYQYNSKLTLAVEGFGTVERLGDSGWSTQATAEVIQELADVGVNYRSLFRDHDQHYVGPVVYYKLLGEAEGAGGGDDDEKEGEGGESPSLTMGLGVLFGLNSDTPDTAIKWSLASEF